ncbi:MAG: hypothetical protein HRT73_11600, partial [Flavobacteriales bacterium]|nr:hypothetical protein [Flavobacteriales bacterium]
MIIRKLSKAIILLISLFGILSIVSASHFSGTEITYQCTGANQYLVTLKFYRDCDGATMPTTTVLNYSSVSCGISANISLNLQSSNDITPLCLSATSSCSGGNNAGVEQYIYQGIINLPISCNDWILSSSGCCRNSSITNLLNPGSLGMYVEATLNNVLANCNNSPSFTSAPQLFSCAGQTINYQQLAYDSDGDSLVYSLVNAMQDATTPVAYAGGFSGTNPFTSPAVINQQTGQITFTPLIQQVAVIAVLIEEYRNGILIGSIVRDIQFIISNCLNTIPSLSGINGVPGDFEILACEGSTICFDVNGNDVNVGQNINMTYSNNIPGASFVQIGTGSAVTGTFCWNTSIGDVGTYVLSINIEDDACPMVGQNAQTYILNIIPNPNPPIIASNNVSICEGDTASINATTTAPSGTIASTSWSPALNISNPNNLSTNVFPSTTTSYTVTLNYTDGCIATDVVSVIINETPIASAFPRTKQVCGGSNFTLTGSTDIIGNTFEWFDPSATSLGSGTVSGAQTSLTITTPTATGTYPYVLQVTNSSTGCVATDTTFLIIGTPPILASCVNIYVSTTGTITGQGTQADPTTLVEGISRAACNNAVIKIATGTYNINNALNLGSFLTLEGGFMEGNAWTKTSTPGATTINRTTANPEGTINNQRLVTFYGNSNTGFRLQDLTITTDDANQPGMSIYGIHLSSCSNNDIVRCQINVGNAGNGALGTPGINGLFGVNGANGNGGDGDDQSDSGEGGNGATGAGTNS